MEASAFVAPGAVLIGRVRLRAQASVWYNATLRGDNEWIEIGERSNVQDNSVVHTDMGAPLVVGADVTIGHSVTLHGCTIEDQALIGMGSTLMNHAVIGTGSILGANSLVPEGKRIPPGVLALGAPAKVVRELKPEEKQLIRASALHYVANADRHRGANVIDDRANT
ncbi:MAG: gamma carbonic anhydrase family protein [Rhodothalassiaceae bacterium]